MQSAAFASQASICEYFRHLLLRADLADLRSRASGLLIFVQDAMPQSADALCPYLRQLGLGRGSCLAPELKTQNPCADGGSAAGRAQQPGGGAVCAGGLLSPGHPAAVAGGHTTCAARQSRKLHKCACRCSQDTGPQPTSVVEHCISTRMPLSVIRRQLTDTACCLCRLRADGRHGYDI